MECIISRSSVINRCNEDGELHLLFTEKEKPCEEAYIKELLDSALNSFAIAHNFAASSLANFFCSLISDISILLSNFFVI